MRSNARGMVVGAALVVLAAPSAASDVFVEDLHEHKVVVAGPRTFDGTQEQVDMEAQGLARFACSLYGRSAIGPLSLSYNECSALRSKCRVFYLYGCATHVPD